MPWIDSCDFILYYIPNETIVNRTGFTAIRTRAVCTTLKDEELSGNQRSKERVRMADVKLLTGDTLFDRGGSAKTYQFHES